MIGRGSLPVSWLADVSHRRQRPGSRPARGALPGDLFDSSAEILGMFLDDEDVPRFGEHRLDRRTMNWALAALAATGTRAA